MRRRGVLPVAYAIAFMLCGGQGPAALNARQADSTNIQETDVQAASRFLGEGRPWEASRILTPLLRDSLRRTPEVVLLAATAAAQWGGWTEVERILRSETWLDRDGGKGRWLLARSAFERRQDTVALRELRKLVPNLRDVSVPSSRIILLARLFDRLDQRDSARVAYERAAELNPAIADWLRLRAAGVTEDSTLRPKYYRLVRGDAARERVQWTEAQARERMRDFRGAAQLFARLGARASALRLRIIAASDPAEKQAIRRELVALVADNTRSSDEGRMAIEVLDLYFTPLTPDEELVVARRASVTGPAARSEQGFSRAFAAKAGTDDDRFAYGSVLLRLGKARDAAEQFAKVVSGPLVGQATYHRARALLRAGQADAARAALERIPRAFPRDTVAASLALYLLADLATDDNRDVEARRLFRDLVQKYPTSVQAPQAAFRAALIAFIAGDARAARAEFDSLVARKGANSEMLAAMYWSGRSHAATGDTTRAKERWRAVIERDPVSYYALTSARRLGETPWAPRAGSVPIPRVAEVDSAMTRASYLDQLGMPVEARFELDKLMADALKSTDRLHATAFAMLSYDEASRAIELARQIFARGAGDTADANLYKVMYPITAYPVLRMEAGKRDVDFALVAAIIRQESRFNPRAVSPAGAVGLMQLMPPVARDLARSLRFPLWDDALLFQPDVNVQLGVAHFAGYLRRYPVLPHALAAYNAGSSRVTRWLTKAGASDPEVFIERIPFTETRDYVRIVERNRALYDALYPASGHIPLPPKPQKPGY